MSSLMHSEIIVAMHVLYYWKCVVSSLLMFTLRVVLLFACSDDERPWVKKMRVLYLGSCGCKLRCSEVQVSVCQMFSCSCRGRERDDYCSGCKVVLCSDGRICEEENMPAHPLIFILLPLYGCC